MPLIMQTILTLQNAAQSNLKPELQESILPSAVLLAANVARGCQLGSRPQSTGRLGAAWPTEGAAWRARAAGQTSDCWHKRLHHQWGNHNPAYQRWRSIKPLPAVHGHQSILPRKKNKKNPSPLVISITAADNGKITNWKQLKQKAVSLKMVEDGEFYLNIYTRNTYLGYNSS